MEPEDDDNSSIGGALGRAIRGLIPRASKSLAGKLPTKTVAKSADSLSKIYDLHTSHSEIESNNKGFKRLKMMIPFLAWNMIKNTILGTALFSAYDYYNSDEMKYQIQKLNIININNSIGGGIFAGLVHGVLSISWSGMSSIITKTPMVTHGSTGMYLMKTMNSNIMTHAIFFGLYGNLIKQYKSSGIIMNNNNKDNDNKDENQILFEDLIGVSVAGAIAGVAAEIVGNLSLPTPNGTNEKILQIIKFPGFLRSSLISGSISGSIGFLAYEFASAL